MKSGCLGHSRLHTPILFGQLIKTSLIPVLALTLGSSALARELDTVSIHEAYVTFRAVCDELGKTDKLQYDIPARLAQRKVAVYCKDRSTTDVRKALAALFEAEWQIKGSVCALVTNPAKATTNLRTRRLKDVLNVLAWVGSQDLTVPQIQGQYDGPATTTLSREDVLSLQRYREVAPWAWACSRDLEKWVKVLDSGQPIKFTTEKEETNLLLAPESAKAVQEGTAYPTRALLFLSAERDELDLLSFVASPFRVDSVFPVPSFVSVKLDPIDDKAALERGWTATITGATRMSAPPDQRTERDYFCGAWGLAECGKKVFEQTGRPIVCDSFRLAVGPQDQPQIQKLEDYLTYIVQKSRSRAAFAPILGVKEVDDWIVLRTARDDVYSQREIPETVLQNFEAKCASRTPLIDDYARFASSLPASQENFWNHRPYALVRFPTFPLTYHIPQLRFWASLTSGQKKDIFGAGLRAADFSGPQLQRLQNALLAALYHVESPLSAFVDLFAWNRVPGPLTVKCSLETLPYTAPNPEIVPGASARNASGTSPAYDQAKLQFVMGDHDMSTYIMLPKGKAPSGDGK